MRSATSCFNLTLYQKNLSRFWPIWALYGLIWLFLLPISILFTLLERRLRYAGFGAGCAV